MNINIEVFDNDAIENVVTCLNFKMDKVIFFGQADTMTQEAKDLTEHALHNICGVSSVAFETVSMKDIDRVHQTIAEVVHREERAGGKCFFDLTGGGDMVLVAMGMYSATHNIPMHRFDISDGELRIINTDAEHIDKCVERRHIPLSIEKLVQLHGGVVDDSMQKGFKDGLADPALRQDVYALWQIADANMDQWNGFSSVLKATKVTKFGKPDTDIILNEWLERTDVQKQAKDQKSIVTEANFVRYLEKLQTAGCIQNLTTHDEWISFRYKNTHIRSWLLDAGSLLELHTYFDRLDSGLYEECRIGTHLKWGINAADDGYMVNNEIDVLLLRGYVLTFISCKAGAPDQMALYELDTVAFRFGGKYAQKELVTASKIEAHHRQRAEEMAITVLEV